MRLILGVLSFWGVVFLGVFSWVYLPEASALAPVAIVVPHHDMVADTRAAYFAEVAQEVQPKTIVLISPDHYDGAKASIVGSDHTWNTSVGKIEPAKELLIQLGLTIHQEPFFAEHGITSIITDIKTNFPTAEILPVLINRRATYNETVTFTRNLYKACPNCLVIASVDFSHTNHVLLADLHDEIALRGLYELDSKLLYENAEVDSPETLVAFTTWARLHGAKAFDLFSHTNSGFLTKTPTGEMTTHIIGGYRKGEWVEPESSTTFMLAGDTMFARGVATQNKSDDIFAELGDRFFWGVDASVVGLEGVFSVSPSTTEGWKREPPKLFFPKKYAPLLQQQHIKAAAMANNHQLDAGEEGLLESVVTLRTEGVESFGLSTEIGPESVYRVTDTGVPMVVINVYTHEPFTNLVPIIRDYKIDGYKVVIYAHWGEEYATMHNPTQKQMAHDWIDAGADLVVGVHPHVVQDVAVYKGVPIVYSLGNFLFDQGGEETSRGLVLAGKFTESTLELFMIPVNSYLRPNILSPAENTELVEKWSTGWTEYKTDEGLFVFE